MCLHNDLTQNTKNCMTAMSHEVNIESITDMYVSQPAYNTKNCRKAMSC